ncbi:glycosyltransferase family 2 protein [Marinobacter salinexigens]|uniref:Glycosyltransferase family 2 protein n=1 Tax=Marinobacter salinexigens TaxID=2919747 RepID=A0A5B0VNT8_9GAMM|nr:glycosyltransferase family 2 protein [Marinobacter salinexigens]KAA1176390.1 glycosyltransferase family 2 protein [Marinobacter salinexigens]
MANSPISIIIPAKNEASNLRKFLPDLMRAYGDQQVILVDDGSTDDTRIVAEEHGLIVVRHENSKGNGAAIKSGVRASTGEILVFMDGDGQHSPRDIPQLLAGIDEGLDMVVGARDSASQASIGRGLANRLYNRLATYMTGERVSDLTSGFRAARAEKFRQFLYLLPNGFSYPTTSTMAFFRAGYQVGYISIKAAKREGKSHIRPIKDGVRFLLIIFKIGTLYSPLKVFVPVSVSVFLIGLLYYGYTYFSANQFTNMSALMFTTSLVIFMVGLVSEQITALMYKDSGK